MSTEPSATESIVIDSRLRQAVFPDVLIIDARTRKTLIPGALTYAETGAIYLSTEPNAAM